MFVCAALGAVAVCALPVDAAVIDMEILSVTGDPNFDPATDSFFDANFHQGLAGMGMTQILTFFDNDGLWMEFEIKITRSAGSSGEEMVATDIDVTNNTNQHVPSMHFEIGMGLGANYQEYPGLAFKGLTSAFPPNELLGRFPNVSQNLPSMPTEIWFEGPPGLAPGDVADFWLAFKIPDSKFVNDMATITFRHHDIPTPASISLLGFSALLATRRRRRR